VYKTRKTEQEEIFAHVEKMASEEIKLSLSEKLGFFGTLGAFGLYMKSRKVTYH
jgi:hypothetical protein